MPNLIKTTCPKCKREITLVPNKSIWCCQKLYRYIPALNGTPRRTAKQEARRAKREALKAQTANA